MWLTVILGFILIVFYLLYKWRTALDLSHLPGIHGSAWWMVFDPPDPSKAHLFLHDLCKKYGPVYKIPAIGSDDVVIVCDYDSIHQVSIGDGKVCGGRPSAFRPNTVLKNTGILMSRNPDEKWKALRKTSQRHLRQFGDGMSRLEAIIVDISEDMFTNFQEHVGESYNPRQVIFNTALSNIAFLILGQRVTVGDPVLKKMRDYEKLFLEAMPMRASLSLLLLDAFPWLRFFGYPKWNLIKRILKLENDIWSVASGFALENTDVKSICREFLDCIDQHDNNINETDATKTTMALILAGITTTSNTFYGVINILAHHPHVQDKIYEEIQNFREEYGRDITLEDRPKVHYIRAVMLEALRYTSVVANGIAHRTLSEVNLKGYKIPQDATVVVSIWALHHDEEFWNEPYKFDPQRFLDEDGKLVLADHPNRKHLMPFGAGPRVCLGESFAMARLFIWLVTLVARYELEPAEGNKKSSADPRNYQFTQILQPLPYNVVFKARE